MSEQVEIRKMISAESARDITTNAITWPQCKGVYIGVSEQFDFYFPSVGWVAFGGCVAGTILPIQVTGARDSGDAAPSSSQIIFLY